MKTIFITQPLLPKKEDMFAQIEEIFASKHLTNMGAKHNLLEQKLKEVLKVPHLQVFNNGTTALLIALKSLKLPFHSEVITTPFTFAATPYSISWNELNPVFCDIEQNTMTIDADKIESLITKKTSAILAVHVYGFPCNVVKIEKMAKKYDLKVIYDAAHAFTTEIDGKGIGTFGDITMFSFHATKLFNTIAGGALTFNSKFLEREICNLRNFGRIDESAVEDIGLNGKLNEFQAAFGLLNLEIFEKEKQKRAKLKDFYDKNLSKIKGIRIPQMPGNVTNSYQYYPIVIEDDYAINRDELYEKFRKNNIMVRKYFYPACSDYECYKDLASSKHENLPVTNDIKNRVLCLPFYGELSLEDTKDIFKILV
ncbi:MAG: DegT/DnrJ/EryC1/StrS family aminotransferase [Endomicrobium sp.]|jgi:dTDP-4-amino-4,6-dideoxygalactose transaminase|nr:DegT/DnrJ/EryC1/StrS family aminotransferase [Endomicrobium sp.]